MHAEKIKIFSRSVVQQFCLLQWVSIRSIRFSSISNAIDLTQSYPSVTIVGEDTDLFVVLLSISTYHLKDCTNEGTWEPGKGAKENNLYSAWNTRRV